MVDETLTDGAVAAGGDGHLELGADSIGRGHEHRLFVPLGEPEEPAEGALVGKDPGGVGVAHHLLDLFEGLVLGIDVYACVFVGCHVFSRSRARARCSQPYPAQ